MRLPSTASSIYRILFAACLLPALAAVISARADASLGPVRFEDFESGWPGATGPLTSDHGWVTSPNTWIGQPPVAWGFGTWESSHCFLSNELGTYVRSPLLVGGVGAVYFRARNMQSTNPITFSIDVSNDGVNWEEDVATGQNESYNLHNPAAGETWHYFELNRYDDVYVRIRRTNISLAYTQRFALDLITVSPVPSNVALTERQYHPGYPSQHNEVKVRVFVQDIAPDLAPSSNRVVTVSYRWQGGDLSSTDMVLVEEGSDLYEEGRDLYEGVIPAHPPGTVEYYFECHFDGYAYAHNLSGHDEKKSPSFLPASDTVERPPEPGFTDWLRYQVRMFDSSHSELRVVDPTAGFSHPMILVDDYTWMAVVEVSDHTNLVVRFEGENAYTNNAPQYQDFADFWGEDHQGAQFPPLAGFCQKDPTPRIDLDFDDEGFLMFRLCTEPPYEYNVRRAVFQDFDEWPGRQDKFEYSQGLYGVQTFAADIDSWSTDGYDSADSSSEDFSFETRMDDSYQSEIETVAWWGARNARRIEERVNAPVYNKALKLNNLVGSRVWNSGRAMPDGLRRFSFRYRSSLDDDLFAWYRQGYHLDVGGMRVEADIQAGSISPDLASISLLARVADTDNYYEYRIVQVRDSRAAQDGLLQAEIWRHKQGVPVRLHVSGQFDGLLLTSRTISLQVEDDPTSQFPNRVRLTGVVGGITRNNGILDTAGITDPGTFGVHSRDAVPLVNSITVYDLEHGLQQWNTGFTGADPISGWATRGQRPDNGEPRWVVSNSRLTRPLPAQTFHVQTAPAGEAPSPFGPASEGDWVTVTSFQSTSLAYQSGSVTPQLWDRRFASIMVDGGDSPLVVDDLQVEPWRARTYYGPGQFLVSEAWVRAIGHGFNALRFDRTRADPSQIQGITSPLLVNGIGTIKFDYTVAGGNAVIELQRTVPGDPADFGVTLDVKTLGQGSSGEYYFTIRDNMEGEPGYLRLIVRSDSSPQAILDLTDIIFTDFPPVDETTWLGYNVLVTGTPPLPPDGDPDRLFLPADPFGRTAFLNNDFTADVAAEFSPLDESAPYIQSPSIGTGIGEIGFWYRVWDPDDPTPARLYLRKAPYQDYAGEWATITNLVLEHSEDFQYFSMDEFDTENKVFRLYSCTAGSQRVAIDNLLVTEPVRAGFDIVNVTLDPPQPLAGEDIYVEARLANFVMSPDNINLRVEYYVGTNVWGRENWPVTNISFMAQDELDDRLYRTITPLPFIQQPEPGVDDVVQYVVTATYEGTFASPLEQEEFTNPHWYDPINLNQPGTYPGWEPDGWSPYFFVYSCPPGSVWINEFNHDLIFTTQHREYVELMGRAGSDIGGWKIKLIGTDMIVYDQVTVEPGFTLANVEKGWGFYVWGDPEVAEIGTLHQAFDEPRLNNIRTIGGVQLERSMGAWEHRVSYGGTMAEAMEQYGFDYIVPRKATWVNSPYHLYTEAGGEEGSSYQDFAWGVPFSGNYTPGGINFAQDVVTLEAPPSLDPVSFAITDFRIEGANLVIETLGTNQWSARPYYRTGLSGPGAWDPVPNYLQDYQDGRFTITLPRPEQETTVIFYRIIAEPDD